MESEYLIPTSVGIKERVDVINVVVVKLVASSDIMMGFNIQP